MSIYGLWVCMRACVGCIVMYMSMNVPCCVSWHMCVDFINALMAVRHPYTHFSGGISHVFPSTCIFL